MIKDDNCIFCKIIWGEIPSYLIYQDENVCAFLDVSPVSYGHTIVIPKDHYQNFLEFADEKIPDFFKIMKKIAAKVKNNLGAAGFNIIQNNFTAAGQVVNHMHYHIIPRYENDKIKLFPLEKLSPSPEEFQALQRKINN